VYQNHYLRCVLVFQYSFNIYKIIKWDTNLTFYSLITRNKDNICQDDQLKIKNYTFETIKDDDLDPRPEIVKEWRFYIMNACIGRRWGFILEYIDLSVKICNLEKYLEKISSVKG
jgi:hypothetical protein